MKENMKIVVWRKKPISLWFIPANKQPSTSCMNAYEAASKPSKTYSYPKFYIENSQVKTFKTAFLKTRISRPVDYDRVVCINALCNAIVVADIKSGEAQKNNPNFFATFQSHSEKNRIKDVKALIKTFLHNSEQIKNWIES